MLAQRIRKLRMINDMTQGEFAEKIGISKSAVGMYEQGRREPTYDILIKISNVFNVKIDWLLSEKEEIRELEKLLEELFINMRQCRGLMFSGQYLSVDDIEKIINSIESGAKMAINDNSFLR